MLLFMIYKSLLIFLGGILLNMIYIYRNGFKF